MEFKFNTVFDILSEQVNKFPDKPYLIKKETYTYKQVFNLVIQLAEILRNNDTGKKTVVLTITSGEQIALCFWACMFNGYDFVLSGNNDLYKQALSENFGDSGIVNVFDFESQFQGLLTIDANTDDIYLERNSNNADVWFFSSGTTGQPKLIKNTSFQFLNALSYIGLNNSLEYLNFCDSVFIAVPLSHSYGLCCLLEYTMAGCTVILPVEQTFIGPVKALFNLPVTTTLCSIEGVPYFYEQLLAVISKLKLPHLKHIGFGGDSVKSSIIESLNTRFPDICYSIRYGISEIPSMISIKKFVYADKSDLKLMPHAFAIYKAFVKGINEADTNEVEYGQLCIQTNIDKETKITIETGDIVTIEAGQMAFHGRLKNIYKHKGYKINSLIIEERINLFPGINGCKVFVNEKNILKAEFQAHKTIVINNLIRYLTDFLPDYMLPELFEQVLEFKRTLSGKLVRGNYQ